MNRPICREDDATSHGGKVIKVSGNVPFNGKRAARLGDWVSCPKHGDNQIIEAGNALTDGGIPIVLDGCHSACGSAVIATAIVTVAV